ncbi:MAG: NAD(P)H-dependent oxidoreductase [Oscillospiraceae bacterium]
MSLTVVMPENAHSAPLLALLSELLAGKDWTPTDRLENLAGKRLLFAVALDEGGCNESCYRMLGQLRREPELLEGCVAGVVVTGTGELYTKALARELVLAANLAGCAFLGRPLVEATGSLSNFRTQAAIYGTDLNEAYRRAVAELLERLESWSPLPPPGRVLALHASVRDTSNTLALWELVKRHLPDSVEIEELNLRNGTIADCSGCSYTTCLHFGERGGCFYGGPMVEQVFPAVRRCDTLIMLCANYNDALSANLTAFVNRLTALFRQSRFYDKQMYGLVVSGYSGGDLLAQQLISALNMNKSFFLPPRFVLMETANDKGSLLRLEGVEQRGEAFARRMMGL